MASIFLSHSSSDIDIVNSVGACLRDAGIDVWIDRAEMKVGEPILEKITVAIEESDFIAVFLSAESVQSSWVQTELRLAMDKEVMTRRALVLPIILEDITIPRFLSSKLYADLRDKNNLSRAVAQLLSAMGQTYPAPTGAESHTSRARARSLIDSVYKVPDGIVTTAKTETSGFELHYLSNHSPATTDILIFFHGLGLDQYDFKDFLSIANCKSYSPTQYGFHPAQNNVRIILDLETHSRILASFVSDVLASHPSSNVTLIGFSVGAEIISLLISRYLPSPRRITRILLLDPNVSRDTCFISKSLATKTVNDANQIFKEIISDEELDVFRVSGYLNKVLVKFRGRMEIISSFAKDVVSSFPSSSFHEFADTLNLLTRFVPDIQCVFSKDPTHIDFLRFLTDDCKLNLPALDQAVSGRRFFLEPELTHFDLISPEKLSDYLINFDHFHSKDGAQIVSD